MKTSLIILSLFLSFALHASSIISLKIKVVSQPADGNTLVVNGSTRTFKNTVATPSSQIDIGTDEDETADNLYSHTTSYPFTGLTVFQTDTDELTYFAETDQAITVAQTGTWATLTLSTNDLDQNPLILPLSTIADGTLRTNLASWLVIGITDYPTNAFPATTAALSNFVSKTQASIITGANVHSNISAIHIPAGAGSVLTTNGIVMTKHATAVSANEGYRLVPDGLGYPLILKWDGTPEAGEPDHLGAIVTLKYLQQYAPKLAAALNTWSGSNQFNGGIKANYAELSSGTINSASIIGGTITNATIGANNLWATDFYSTGTFTITNAQPEMYWRDNSGALAQSEAARFTLNGNAGYYNGVIEGSLGSSLLWLRVKAANPYDNSHITFPTGTTQPNKLKVDNEAIFMGKGGFVGILGVGDTNVTVPTGLTAGIVLSNTTTSASSDPLNGAAIYALNGEVTYRSAATSEGAGQENRIHNRASEVVGSGTDYNLTASYARIDFGGTDPEILLPTAGTYLIEATITVTQGGTAGDSIAAKFYNSTTASDVSNSVATITHLPASTSGQLTLRSIYTTAGGTIQLYGLNNTAARGSIKATETKLSYVRLY